MQKFKVEKKLISFCADNAPVNFGNVNRSGENNVFAQLKKTYPYLTGIGCCAHILHNAIKTACKWLSFDIEYVVISIYTHFYRFAVRTETLKVFCGEVGENFRLLQGYSKTRFLALRGCIDSILNIFDALRAYFEDYNGTSAIIN